ncbi:MAG: protein translocase subunit SecD [Patescibacteria group bacterium]|nr:protein translocase subunit SecD [Patescibacteria group bacterium]
MNRLTKSLIWRLVFIIILVLLALLIILPWGNKLIKKDFPISLGLDLQGGAHLVYQLDLSKVAKEDQISAVDSTLEVVRNRIDKFGVSEPTIQAEQIAGERAVLVELPGIKDLEQAKQLIGSTAQLEFWEQGNTDDKTVVNEYLPGFIPTKLTGKQLKKAQPTVNQQTQAWEVALEFNSEGAKLFADITKRNLGKPVAIVLDNQPVSVPTVQTEITGGSAVITGQFDAAEAKRLAIQLNAGALPVPVKLIEERTVEATLGAEAIHKSLIAGLVGLLIVAIFMLINYHGLGLWAILALAIYTILNIAIYKIFKITLSLSGIAGLILSIGIAVDANILIFSRTKEELAQGSNILQSINDGFKHAWLSIRDSNFSSLITALILFFFGAGQIKGFAITLIIGIVISMFSAIFVTRTFLLFFTSKKKYEKTI